MLVFNIRGPGSQSLEVGGCSSPFAGTVVVSEGKSSNFDLVVGREMSGPEGKIISRFS